MAITRIVSKSTKDSSELAINNKSKLFESDIIIFQMFQVKIIQPKMLPKLNVAFFDIETDFDPERGFADPVTVQVTAIHCTLAMAGQFDYTCSSPKTLTMEQAKEQV